MNVECLLYMLHTHVHTHTHTHTHTLQTTCFCHRPLPTNAGTSLCTTTVRMTSHWGTSLPGSVSSKQAHLYMPETTNTFSCYHGNCIPPPFSMATCSSCKLVFQSHELHIAHTSKLLIITMEMMDVSVTKGAEMVYTGHTCKECHEASWCHMIVT